MEVDAFLKEHGAVLQYTEADLTHDREVATQVAREAFLPPGSWLLGFPYLATNGSMWPLLIACGRAPGT
jgi:hypothetical protein